MTAFEPGASEVLTVGFTRRPRATAFRARRPAPTITVGLEVFVQEVIAAIATDPVLTTTRSPPTSIGTPRYERSSVGDAPATTGSAGGAGCGRSESAEAKAGASDAGNDWAEASSTAEAPGTAASASAASPDCSPSGKLVRKLSRSRSSGTRSCGRRGPATDGTTVARSRTSSSSKVGPSPGSRQSPCVFA